MLTAPFVGVHINELCNWRCLFVFPIVMTVSMQSIWVLSIGAWIWNGTTAFRNKVVFALIRTNYLHVELLETSEDKSF